MHGIRTIVMYIGHGDVRQNSNCIWLHKMLRLWDMGILYIGHKIGGAILKRLGWANATKAASGRLALDSKPSISATYKSTMISNFSHTTTST